MSVLICPNKTWNRPEYLHYLFINNKKNLVFYRFIMRECQETVTINGLEIPAGMGVHIPVWSMHHDPELWEQPEIFNPDRFMGAHLQKIAPMSYLPFGQGPRNCIGMT